MKKKLFITGGYILPMCLLWARYFFSGETGILITAGVWTLIVFIWWANKIRKFV